MFSPTQLIAACVASVGFVLPLAAAEDIKAPASLPQALKVLDLRTLPRLKDSEKPGQISAAALNYDAKATIAAAFAFHLKLLEAQGWKDADQPAARQETEQYAQATLQKQGFTLSLSIFPNGQKPGVVSIMLQNLGDVDTRQLPKPPDGKLLFGARATSMYVTPKKVPDVAGAVAKELQARGWRPYGPAFAQTADNPDQRSLTFMQRGTGLNVFISVAPAQGNQTSLQYSTTLLDHELPAPPDATDIAFDPQRPHLEFLTRSDAAGLRAFYEQALPPLGYKPREVQSGTTLPFDGADGSLLLVERQQQGEQTRVKLVYVPPEVVAAAKEPKPTKPAEKPTAPAADVGLTARQVPVPKGATELEYDADGGEIRFTSALEVKELADYYRKEFGQRGWKESRDFTVIEKNVGSWEFKKEQAELDFTLINLGLGGGTQVKIAVKGLSWKAEGKK